MKAKPRPQKSGRKRGSAGELYSPANTFARNLGVALFGKAVRSAEHEAKLYLVGEFEAVASLTEPGQARARTHALAHAHRRFDGTARPELLDALLRQDPQPFRDFADAIEAAQRIRQEGPIQAFHRQALLTAIALAPDFAPGQALPVTLKEFKAAMRQRFWPTRPTEQLPADEYVRRECKQLGIHFTADTVGRPRKVRTIPARRKS